MIDKNKTYRTRDGREVRIYATDGGGNYPVHGAVKTKHREWQQLCWTSIGLFHLSDGCSTDLIEVKPRIKRTVWINVYERSVAGWNSKDKADGAGPGRLACVKVEIDVEEGEGL